MRALLVCAAPVEGSARIVADLARHHELVVGVDGGAALCDEAGVVPGLVVGDIDSLDSTAASALIATGVELRRFPADKDVTDLDLAIGAARDAGASRITVTGCLAARLDHTLATIGSLARVPELWPVAVEPHVRAWVLSAEHRSGIELEGRGATVSLLPVLGPCTVSCIGMRWPLDSATLEPLGSLGVSNVIVADSASVRLHAGTLLVLSEPLAGAPSATDCDLRHIFDA
jgi:thiamine pyrophosphokinase